MKLFGRLFVRAAPESCRPECLLAFPADRALVEVTAVNIGPVG